MSQFGTKLNSRRRLSFILVRQTKQKSTSSEVQNNAMSLQFYIVLVLELFCIKINLITISFLFSVGMDTVKSKAPPCLCLENGCRDSSVHEGFLWIGKISCRFHKHTILQISLKIWAGGLRVIPKNGETKSGPNRANSQRNTNTQNTEFMNLDSILLLCAKVIFSEMEKILKLKLRSS